MKKLIPFLIALFLMVNASARVRTSPPEKFTVTGVRVVAGDTFIRYSFDFGINAVYSVGCGCVVKRKAAVYLFGWDSLSYVKPRDLDRVYEIIQSK